ncbi:MAG: hypothetical protein ACE5DX_02275 [Candidatus Dojkabacteria bacterium]
MESLHLLGVDEIGFDIISRGVLPSTGDLSRQIQPGDTVFSQDSRVVSRINELLGQHSMVEGWGIVERGGEARRIHFGEDAEHLSGLITSDPGVRQTALLSRRNGNMLAVARSSGGYGFIDYNSPLDTERIEFLAAAINPILLLKGSSEESDKEEFLLSFGQLVQDKEVRHALKSRFTSLNLRAGIIKSRKSALEHLPFEALRVVKELERLDSTLWIMDEVDRQTELTVRRGLGLVGSSIGTHDFAHITYIEQGLQDRLVPARTFLHLLETVNNAAVGGKATAVVICAKKHSADEIEFSVLDNGMGMQYADMVKYIKPGVSGTGSTGQGLPAIIEYFGRQGIQVTLKSYGNTTESPFWYEVQLNPAGSEGSIQVHVSLKSTLEDVQGIWPDRMSGSEVSVIHPVSSS